MPTSISLVAVRKKQSYCPAMSESDAAKAMQNALAERAKEKGTSSD